MENTFPTKAIIINRRNWREADRLVSVYTPDYGSLSLVARGACKLNSKLAAHLEPITIAQLLVIKGKGFDYVGSAIMTESFRYIKEDLNKLYFAGRALDFFSRIIKEGEKDEALFNWLEKWLISLNEAQGDNDLNKHDGRFRLLLFYWRLLALLGYALNLDSCVLCKQKIRAGDRNRLDLVRGGLLCPNCEVEDGASVLNPKNQAVLNISDNCIKLWRYLDGNTDIHLKNVKLSLKLLKEWERLHEKRMNWLDY